MKISSVKTFKSKVLEAVQLIYDASIKPKAHDKYKQMGIQVHRYDRYKRHRGNIETCKVLFFYNNGQSCFCCNGNDLNLSEIDKGTFFNARIMDQSFRRMYMECVATELNKRFNYKQRYEQEYMVYIDELLKYLKISL